MNHKRLNEQTSRIQCTIKSKQENNRNTSEKVGRKTGLLVLLCLNTYSSDLLDFFGYDLSSFLSWRGSSFTLTAAAATATAVWHHYNFILFIFAVIWLGTIYLFPLEICFLCWFPSKRIDGDEDKATMWRGDGLFLWHVFNLFDTKTQTSKNYCCKYLCADIWYLK